MHYEAQKKGTCRRLHLKTGEDGFEGQKLKKTGTIKSRETRDATGVFLTARDLFGVAKIGRFHL